ADCANDGVYEFLFTAPPLHIPGAAGSPINPMAIK
ncbi:MAG: cyclase family protein, partial [Pseudomonadota bacterium]